VEPHVEDFLIAQLNRRGAAVVEALAAAALLDETERRAWDEALQTGALPETGAEPSLSEAELERRVEEFIDARARDEVAGGFMAVGMLRELGLLTDDEHWEWHRRLVDGPAGNGGSDGEWRVELSLEALDAFRGDNLQRVVVGPPERRQGLRVLAVELYGDGALVRWQLVRAGPDYGGELRELADEVEPVDSPLSPNFEVRDDLGTGYAVRGGGSKGQDTDSGDYVAFGTAELTPAVPPDARLLRLESRGTVFEVNLGWAGA
jgi:hypothetical protein